MSLYLYAVILVVVIMICILSKNGTFREGFSDPCIGKTSGCYQLQSEGNLVPAPLSAALSGDWTEESCMNPRLLASGKWCDAGGEWGMVASPSSSQSLSTGCSIPNTFGAGVVGGDTTACITGSLLDSGNRCDVKCDKGYKTLSGTKEYSCDDGAMTRGTLECGPITCKIPASLGKGIRAAPFKGCSAGENLSASKSCSVECDAGYEVNSGNGAYSCSDVGVLSRASLDCNPVTCKLPRSFGDHVEGSGTEGCESGGTILSGTSCHTTCSPGYKKQRGSGTYSCSDGGTLDTGDLKCIKGEKKKKERREYTEDIVMQNITFICDPEESPTEIPEHALARYGHSSYSPAAVNAHRRHRISSSGKMHRVPSSKSVKFPGMSKVRPYDSLMNW
jgi:hypothetical protein